MQIWFWKKTYSNTGMIITAFGIWFWFSEQHENSLGLNQILNFPLSCGSISKCFQNATEIWDFSLWLLQVKGMIHKCSYICLFLNCVLVRVVQP